MVKWNELSDGGQLAALVMGWQLGIKPESALRYFASAEVHPSWDEIAAMLRASLVKSMDDSLPTSIPIENPM